MKLVFSYSPYASLDSADNMSLSYASFSQQVSVPTCEHNAESKSAEGGDSSQEALVGGEQLGAG